MIEGSKGYHTGSSKDNLSQAATSTISPKTGKRCLGYTIHDITYIEANLA
jgi:hypothetical protein